jgi:hypothetical protein
VLTAFVPILNIVMFLVFAFGKWPIQTRLENAERGRSGGYAPPQFVPAGPGPTSAPVAMPPGQFPPPAAPPVQPDASRTIYCSWCGKSRAADAQAIHHCGAKDRPVLYCRNLGLPLKREPSIAPRAAHRSPKCRNSSRRSGRPKFASGGFDSSFFVLPQLVASSTCRRARP